MYHNDIDPINGNQGHWAVGVSGNDADMLVQIGEIEERRQTRLLLKIPTALHLAADLLTASAYGDAPGTMQIGEDEDSAWFIECRKGVATLTLRDSMRIANPEATLAMPSATMRQMALGILRVANGLLGL